MTSTQSRVCVVGGSGGIGRGIVDRLVRAGHVVTVLSRSVGTLEGLAGVRHLPFDAVSDPVPSEAFGEALDGLVYCPGSIPLKPFRSLKPEQYREDFELNVVGAVRVLQAALPALKNGVSPSVVLFSTVAVAQGMFAHASIAAAKGAVEGLVRSLAAELAPAIRVNAIAPALTETPLTARFFADEGKRQVLAEKYPLGRTGTVDDIAAAAMFLLGPESSWITGQILGVDGGMSSVRK